MSDQPPPGLQETLQAELDELRSLEEGSGATDVVELDQTRVGRLSRMDAMRAQAMANATAARRKQRIRQIYAALERLRDGEYGWCVECGEAINPQRLHVDPSTPMCVKCAEHAEL